MNPVHSSLLVLSVASPFLLAVGHFQGISSSPASFIILLLLTGGENKSTWPKYGFVELKTARTDSCSASNLSSQLFRRLPGHRRSQPAAIRVLAPATSSSDRRAPSTACRRRTRAPTARVVSWSFAAN